jgi:hypothetical protein
MLFAAALCEEGPGAAIIGSAIAAATAIGVAVGGLLI